MQKIERTHAQKYVATWRRCLGCLVVVLVMMVMLVRESHEKQIIFYNLESVIDVDTHVVPTYFFESGQFRGYFEIHYHDDFDWSGTQRFSTLINPKMIKVPPVVTENQLTCQYSLLWELKRNESAVFSDMKQTLTIKFFPTFKLNIDPYSVRAYSVVLPLFDYTPMFPTSDNISPTLGPWEFTVSLSDFKYAPSISKTLVFFAYSSTEEKLSSSVSLKYPRDVFYNLQQFEMHILYPNASVHDPSQNIVPTVNVSSYENTLTIPESYVLLGAYTIEEDNKGNFQLDEIRSINHRVEITHGNKKVDSFSLKCAYSTADSDFKTLAIDPTSTTSFATVISSTYTLTCNQIMKESKYVMAVIGKIPSIQICSFGIACALDPKILREFMSTPKLQVSFNSDSQLVGSYTVIDLRLENYKDVNHAKSSQSGLSLSYVFDIDFSQVSVMLNGKKTYESQNAIFVNIESPTKMGVDPYSLRLFMLNSDGNLFEMISEDIPRLGQTSFNLDVEPIVKSKVQKKRTFGLFSYAESNAVIGELVYVHYGREISYSLESHVNLKVYFKPRYITPILYESRPYYSINNYNPANMKGMEDYTVLYSFIQQNGNGLEAYGFDEGRKFLIDFETAMFKFMKIRFSDIKGGYLFQESNFETFEESGAKPVIISNSQQQLVMIELQEDIRDETFAFVLLGKPFVGIVYLKDLNTDSAIIPTDFDRFHSQVLPMDTLTVSFNPNCRSTGNYRLSADNKKFADYSLPETKLKPLSLVGVYILDTTGVNVYSRLRIDTELDLLYEKNSINRNLDPFSYRFFSVDDEKQEFNWLECDDIQSKDPWKLSIDISNNKKLKFAVFAYNNLIGEIGTIYSIHYERSLKFVLSQSTFIEFSFSSKSFPQLNNGVSFLLKDLDNDNDVLDGFAKVKSFSIIQTVRSDISTDRMFIFDSKLRDEYGYNISDFNTLQCFYITRERLIYGRSSVTKTDSLYTLHCSETILHEEYNLVIVAKSSIKPLPSHLAPVDPVHDRNDVTVAVLGFCVAFLSLSVIGLIVVVIYLLFRKKQQVPKEKIFNFEEMKGYNSIEL